jgi:hypothetical protein
MPMISNTPSTTIVGSQSGAVTHHQDHVILLSNFKIRNTIKVAPHIPIPPLELLLLVVAMIFPLISPQLSLL